MQALDVDQIQLIEDRIAHASIKNTSLTVDLLDHICCMIEERIDAGIDYNEAEQEVFGEIGVLQMQAIEQETNILTQNKIVMKRRTRIIGLIAIIFMVVGFLMKQLHLMGAGVTWVIGVLVAAFGFALFLTVDRFQYMQSSKGKIISIIGYLGSASFILGLGLKLLDWPVATNAMIIGGFVLLIHFILSNPFTTQDKLVP